VKRDEFARAIKLFNTGHYFEAHEALEDLWRAAASPDKLFLQGLTQIAVAMVHQQRGNRVGARSLLARGMANLAAYPEQYLGVDVAGLRAAVIACERALDGGQALPPPRMELL
jgi:predicted metal-dependent hydrolase